MLRLSRGILALVLLTAALVAGVGSAALAVGAAVTTTAISQSPTSLTVQVDGTGFSSDFPGVYVGISEADNFSATDASRYRGTQWVRNTSIVDGAFSVTLELDADAIATLDPDKDYAVYTFRAHGMPDADGSQTTETLVALDFVKLGLTSAPTPQVAVSLDQVPADEPATVTVTGTGFDPSAVTATRPPLAGSSGGVYVVFGKFADLWQPSAGASSSARLSSDVKWAVLAEDMATIGGASRGAVELQPDGSFTAELTVDKAAIDELADGRDDLANYGIYTYPGGGAANADYEIYTPISFVTDTSGESGGTGTSGTPTTSQPTADSTSSVVAAGSLQWGISSSFRSYVTGPIASGTVAVSGGARSTGSSFAFPQASDVTVGERGQGSTPYRGAVRFTGHGGALDLTLADPIVRVESTTSGMLSVVVNSRRVDFATLQLGAGAYGADGGLISYSNVPATLTAAGAAAFSGYYSAGQALDPVSFTIGVQDNSASTQAATLVATSSTQSSNTWRAPATPPATTGAATDKDSYAPGEQITVTGSGFAAGETGIKVVVYSSPIVLTTQARADSLGNVSWTGNLPTTLEPGEHTITLQGSTNRGRTFTIVANGVDTCLVDDATVVWGFKESFRAYVSGNIANGGWTTSGNASYATPNFTFADGTGTADLSNSSGDVSFVGGIEFTGHGGALLTTVDNPTVRLLGDGRAVMLVDFSTTSRDTAEQGGSSQISESQVEFVSLDLSAATRSKSGDTVTFTDIPATLTAEGARVFSSYSEGDAFDPVSLTVNTSADCAASTAPAPAAIAKPFAQEEAAGALGLALLVGAVGALVVAGALGVWLIRRRGVGQ